MRVSYHSNCKTQSYIFWWTAFKSPSKLWWCPICLKYSAILCCLMYKMCAAFLLIYLYQAILAIQPHPSNYTILQNKWILSLSKSDLCRMFTNSKIGFLRKWWFREWIMFWVREQCRSYKVNVFKWGDQCFIIFNFEWIVRSCLSTATQPMSFTL